MMFTLLGLFHICLYGHRIAFLCHIRVHYMFGLLDCVCYMQGSVI